MRRFNAVLRLVALAMVLLFTASCTGSEAAQARSEARELWEETGPADYRFMWHTTAMVGESRYIIEVQDGAVSSTKTIEGNWKLMKDGLPTVEQVFATLQQLQEDADSVEVSYDSEFGYPSTVSVDMDANAIDDEFTFRVEDLEPYSPAA